MTILLQQQVTLYEGRTIFSGTKVVIELHDDNRFVMFRLDPTTQLRTETVVDVPLSELSVRGSESQLQFIAAGLKKRVNFSHAVTLGALGGLAGVAIASAMSPKSMIKTWVADLKARGVAVRYTSSLKIVLIALGVIVVLFIVATALGAAGF